jgi:hypothetical protein
MEIIIEIQRQYFIKVRLRCSSVVAQIVALIVTGKGGLPVCSGAAADGI